VGNLYSIKKKRALQHIVDQNQLLIQQSTTLLNDHQVLMQQGNNMTTKLNEIGTVLADVRTNVTLYVATSQKAAAAAKALAAAQAAQIAMLTGEVTTDQAAIDAGKAEIIRLTDAAAQSAAEESSAEDQVLAAATTLDTTVQALNAPPVEAAPETPATSTAPVTATAGDPLPTARTSTTPV
jgi:hypothetical protein